LKKHLAVFQKKHWKNSKAVLSR